jgi:hypothetical protein
MGFDAEASRATEKRNFLSFPRSHERVYFTPGRPDSRVSLGYQTPEVAAQEKGHPWAHIKQALKD